MNGGSNDPPSKQPLSDEALLFFFLTGRGYNAFRAMARDVSRNGWARADLRYMLEALYQRLGVIVRNGSEIHELQQFRRLMKEVLAFSANASDEIRIRVSTLAELVIDLLNQEGGPNNQVLIDDPACLKVLEHLSKLTRATEDELSALFEHKALFYRAMGNLHVAGLVSIEREDVDPWVWKITTKGLRRLEAKDAPLLLQELDSIVEDIWLFTPVRPLFDMMILHFGHAVRDNADRYNAEGAATLSEFGVDIHSEPIEQPIGNWLSLDEVYLQRRSRDPSDITAITGPGKRASRFFQDSVLDVATGNAFIGFHLLVSNEALERCRALNGRLMTAPRFPAAAEEIVSLVPWARFGEWLSHNDLRAEIWGDSGTQPALRALLACATGAGERVTFKDVESNTQRLDHTRKTNDKVINIAVATGPLIAMARSAGLSVLCSSWDMLETARRKQILYEPLATGILKQVVHVAIPKQALGTSDSKREAIEQEDRIFRICAYVETVCQVIVKNPNVFAQFCADQWAELGRTFPTHKEFTFELSAVDIRLAIDASYQWLGHNLGGLKPSEDWPDQSLALRDWTFWTHADENTSFWPSILRRRQQLNAEIESLLSQVGALAALHEPEELKPLRRRVRDLVRMGQLRRAETGLRHALRVLESRGSAVADDVADIT